MRFYSRKQDALRTHLHQVVIVFKNRPYYTVAVVTEVQLCPWVLQISLSVVDTPTGEAICFAPLSFQTNFGWPGDRRRKVAGNGSRSVANEFETIVEVDIGFIRERYNSVLSSRQRALKCDNFTVNILTRLRALLRRLVWKIIYEKTSVICGSIRKASDKDYSKQASISKPCTNKLPSNSMSFH